MKWYLWVLIGYVSLMIITTLLIRVFTYQTWKKTFKDQWIFIFIQPIGILWYIYMIFKSYVIRG